MAKEYSYQEAREAGEPFMDDPTLEEAGIMDDGLWNDRRDPSGSRPRRESSRTHPNEGHLGIY